MYYVLYSQPLPAPYKRLINGLKQKWKRQNNWTTDNLTINKRLLNCNKRRIETHSEQWTGTEVLWIIPFWGNRDYGSCKKKINDLIVVKLSHHTCPLFLVRSYCLYKWFLYNIWYDLYHFRKKLSKNLLGDKKVPYSTTLEIFQCRYTKQRSNEVFSTRAAE